jgi:glutamine synthetase
MLEAMGISVEFSHHESGPGQNEIDLRYADALSTADNIMTFRTVIKEVAIQQGVYATFMPKPMAEHPGSGMHTHMSLFEGDRNAFHDPSGQYGLSKTGRAFNSYKRLWGGDEAPSYVCWGHNNRSALVRVPLYKPRKAGAARVEYRALDSAANPYLSYALLLAAGLKGIEEGYELPEPTDEDVTRMTDAERRVMGIGALPASLDRALTALEASDLVAETLGEHVVDYLIRDKREEWNQYRAQVTPYELRRHLPVL